MAGLDGILVPGGFGDRGIEGKIQAIRYAREQRVPYFGICLGMQCAVIEFARHVSGLAGANSTEFDAAPRHNVIDLLPEQRNIKDKGGTMRLGLYPDRPRRGERRLPGVRAGRDPGAAPPSLRGQQRLSRHAREGGPPDLGHLAGQAAGGDHRAAGPPVVRGGASSTRNSARVPGSRIRSSPPSSRPRWTIRAAHEAAAGDARGRA